MKKTLIIVASVVLVALLGAGAYMLTMNQNNETEETTTMADKTADSSVDGVMKQSETVAGDMKKDDHEGHDHADHDDHDNHMDSGNMASTETKKDSDTSSTDAKKAGTYVSYARYTANKEQYKDTKVVYFFHAQWCSICRGIEKEVNDNTDAIPAGVTMVQVDYDDKTDLRQKYGVTVQSTFVQVDAADAKVAKWSAANLKQAVSGIQ